VNELNLDWKFWKAQLEALQAVKRGDYDIVNFQGGYRSGKSVTGSRAVILNALENPGTRNVAMGVSFQEAKQTTFPVLFEHLPGENLDPYTEGGDPENSPVVKNFNKQDKVLVLKLPGRPSSSISLGSADKASRYEGGKFDMVWMDEAGLYGDKLYGIMQTFLERASQQLWTTTGKTGALRQIIEERVDRNGDPIQNPIKVVKASTLDNPFLPQSRKDQLIRTYGGTKNAEMALEGGFGAVEGLVYSKFNRADHVVKREDVELDDSWGRVYGYDAGWNDPRVLLEIGKTHTGQLVVLDAFYESGSFVEDVIKWLQKNDKQKGRIFAEHEPGDIQKFRRQLGWTVLKAEKDLSEGITEVRQRLQKDGDGRPGLLVCEQVEDLIHEFSNYQEADVGGSDVEDHALDSLRYIVMGLKRQDSASSVGVGSVSAM